MKSVRSSVVVGSVLLAAVVSLPAQVGTVEFILVSREANFVQTDASTLTADSVAPFRFIVAVEGSNMTSSSPLTAASFTWPRGSSIPLTFDPWGNDWSYENSDFASMAALNTAYGTGNYDISLTGSPTATVSIGVASFAASTLQVPLLALTGGTWMGNAYVLGASDSLTVTFNPVYTGTVSGTQGFNYYASIGGSMNSFEKEGFINYDPLASRAVPGGSTPAPWVVGVMPVGMYSVEVGYSDIQNPTTVLGNVTAVSLLQYRTNLQLVVVPEPSTYALCALGLGVLGLAHWRRRRA